jgi:sec-independent protein translocase protein TatC
MEAAVLTYMTELRRRLVYALLVLSVVFVALYSQANILYAHFAHPLLQRLPGKHLIATSLMSPLLTPLKLCLLLSFILTVPWLLYQLWSFVAPALYRHERAKLWPLFCLSVVLCYLGMVFAYFVVLPLCLRVLIAMTPEGVSLMPDMSHYLSFVSQLVLGFALAFQAPVVTWLLVRTGVYDVQQLAAKRSYVVVLSFVVGMLLTPPDVVSQVMLALPLWGLFELGLLCAKWSARPLRV